jgi:hypothetical protein
LKPTSSIICSDITALSSLCSKSIDLSSKPTVELGGGVDGFEWPRLLKVEMLSCSAYKIYPADQPIHLRVSGTNELSFGGLTLVVD